MQPAKQATAYSPGWSEALRAQPWVSCLKTFQPAERAAALRNVCRPLRGLQFFIAIGPRVALPKPRSTLGYMGHLLRRLRTQRLIVPLVDHHSSQQDRI